MIVYKEEREGGGEEEEEDEEESKKVVVVVETQQRLASSRSRSRWRQSVWLDTFARVCHRVRERGGKVEGNVCGVRGEFEKESSMKGGGQVKSVVDDDDDDVNMRQVSVRVYKSSQCSR